MQHDAGAVFTVQIHGNVCMAAVVVTESLDWRLHGFDLLSEHSGTADMPLLNASWMVGSQYKPGEVTIPAFLFSHCMLWHSHSVLVIDFSCRGMQLSYYLLSEHMFAA